MLRYNLRYQAFLALIDAILVIIALALSSFIRLNVDVGAEGESAAFETPLALYLIAPLIWLFALGKVGAYQTGETTIAGTLRRVGGGHILAALIFLGVLYLGFRDYSRLQAFYFLVLGLLFLWSSRLIMAVFNRRLAQAINTPRRVLIVGVSETARRVGAAVSASEKAGLQLLGYVQVDSVGAGLAPPADAPPADTNPPDTTDLLILGKLDDLSTISKQHRADEIIIALKWFDEDASKLVSHIMGLLERNPVNIRIAPDYSELAYFNARPEDFNGITLISLRESILTPAQRIVKRLFDIVFASLMILFTLPLWGVIAIAIRRDSPGPIIFRQQRIGMHGRRFTIYKFRTMYVNADRVIDTAEFRKMEDDPRVTRVGHLLRRTSLDELPQFINILKGDMSVVGPRPEVIWLASDYEWWQRKRYEVPQGLTGWWQVNGRSDKPMRFHIEEDLYYVRHYSLWLDMQIIAKTVISVFTGKGAY
jgi:exopolysaccharide biosynthesis polyprenyl glycosylphosphotransferase